MNKKRVAIIPAAGRGVRFRELGKHYPKCLLPYNNRPIIQHTIDKIDDMVDEIRVVVGHQGDEIRAYFKNNPNKKVKIVDLDTTGPQGPAKSMFCALNGREGSVLMLLSDSIFDFDIEPGSESFLTAMPVRDFSRWCMVDANCNFYDKPKKRPPTELAVSGVYYFTSPEDLFWSCDSVLQYHDETEVQFSEVFDVYKQTQTMKVVPHLVEDIIDFGTLEEFYQNRGLGKPRAFNEIWETEDGTVVKKSSVNPTKVLAEAFWMEHSPKNFQKYIPRVYSIDVLNGQFEMEKVTSPNLRELYLYLDKSYETWDIIFKEIRVFLDKCKETTIRLDTVSPFWSSMLEKTKSRHSEGEVIMGKIDSLRVRNRIFSETSYYHGDLHFNNMFFSFSSKQLTLVDPRGEFQGHYLYDIAKLYHSVYGMYDYIDEGLYSVSDTTLYYDKGNEDVRRAFDENVMSMLNAQEVRFVRLLTASLFLSMIPLHYENPTNQRLFYEEYHRIKNTDR